MQVQLVYIECLKASLGKSGCSDLKLSQDLHTRKLIFTMYNMPLARTVTEVRTMHRDA